MNPAVCPTCGDDVEWCPQSPDYVPVAQRIAPEYKPLVTCGYCDAPTWAAGPGHSRPLFALHQAEARQSMTQTEFYDVLDQINRDFREGRISYRQHDDEVVALVDAYERKAA